MFATSRTVVIIFQEHNDFRWGRAHPNGFRVNHQVGHLHAAEANPSGPESRLKHGSKHFWSRYVPSCEIIADTYIIGYCGWTFLYALPCSRVIRRENRQDTGWEMWYMGEGPRSSTKCFIADLNSVIGMHPLCSCLWPLSLWGRWTVYRHGCRQR